MAEDKGKVQVVKSVEILKKIVDISVSLIYNISRVTERTLKSGRAPAKRGVAQFG